MGRDLLNFYNKIKDVKTAQEACNELVVLIKNTIGAKLVTLMTLDEKQNVACRIYSSMPDKYSVKGTKPLESSDWSALVLEQGKTFVANTIEEIDSVFPDAQLIQSLGCESVINIPIKIQNEVLGSVNILHEKGHYTPELVEKSEILKLPASLCFLMLKNTPIEGTN